MSLTSRSAISLVKVSLTFIRMTVTESAAGGMVKTGGFGGAMVSRTPDLLITNGKALRRSVIFDIFLCRPDFDSGSGFLQPELQERVSTGYS